MSEIARTLGLPRPFRFEGRDHPVAERDFYVEGLFELWLEQQAADAVERHKERMHPAVYADHLAGWRRDCASHVYAFGGPEAVKAMYSMPGAKHLAFLQMRQASKDATEELVERISRDPEAWRRLTAVVWFGEHGEADNDPLAPAAA